MSSSHNHRFQAQRQIYVYQSGPSASPILWVHHRPNKINNKFQISDIYYFLFTIDGLLKSILMSTLYCVMPWIKYQLVIGCDDKLTMTSFVTIW